MPAPDAYPRRVAMVSVHTSPLATPGVGDAGGLNVYVAELSRRLGARGIAVDVFTRAEDDGPDVVEVAEHVRVVQLPVGPRQPVAKEELPALLPAFTAALEQRLDGHDLLHSHYWLSGQVGLSLARARGLPLVHTMHTMARVKNDALGAGHTVEPDLRERGEAEVVAGADVLTANTSDEADELQHHYGADRARIAVVPPGVDLRTFHTCHQPSNRAHLDVAPEAEVVLFVGRIQPLKAPDVVIRAVAELVRRDPARRDRLRLIIIGSPSGPQAAWARSLGPLAAGAGRGRPRRAAPPLRARRPVPVVLRQRRRRRPLLQRVVRARRPGGAGVRPARRRHRRRRPAARGPRRPDGPAGQRARHGALGRRARRRPGRPRRARGDGRPARPATRRGSAGTAPPRRRCGPTTRHGRAGRAVAEPATAAPARTSTAWRAVVGFGVVSLAADMVYEGARSVTGPLLASLGATAVVVGVVTGLGEAIALVLRLFSGRFADRSGRYWGLTLAGYALTAVCVPLLAVTPFLGGAGLAVADRAGAGRADRQGRPQPGQVGAARHRGGGGGARPRAGRAQGARPGRRLRRPAAGRRHRRPHRRAVAGARRPRRPRRDRPGPAALGAPPGGGAGAAAGRADDGPGFPPWRARLPRAFWWFAASSGAATAGLVTFGVISFHLTRDQVLPVAARPGGLRRGDGRRGARRPRHRLGLRPGGRPRAAGAARPGGAGAAARLLRRRRAGGGRRAGLGRGRRACRTPRSRRSWPTSSRPAAAPGPTGRSPRSRAGPPCWAARRPAGCTSARCRRWWRVVATHPGGVPRAAAGQPPPASGSLTP